MGIHCVPELTLMYVEGESQPREKMTGMLLPLAQKLVVAGSAAEALELCRGNAPDIVVADARLPDMGVPELAKALKSDGYRGKILLLCGTLPAADCLAAMNAGINRILMKPVLKSLREAVDALGGEAISERSAMQGQTRLIEQSEQLQKQLLQLAAERNAALDALAVVAEAPSSAGEASLLTTAVKNLLTPGSIPPGGKRSGSVTFGLKEVMRECEKFAGVAGMVVAADLPSCLEGRLVGDRGLLTLMLASLVRHAEHLAAGTMGIAVELKEKSGETILCQFALEIPLPHISVNIMETLDSYCFRKSAADPACYDPNNSGLFLAQRAIAAAGGNGWVKSEQGRGMTIYAKLPFVSHEQIASSPCQCGLSQQATVTPLDILIAEDNFIEQRSTKRILEKKGHRVTVVSDGREALVALDVDKFDLVLMDILMPEMDGLEATRRIRAAEKERGLDRHMPIIALTAHDLNNIQRSCIEAGMDDCLAKPVYGKELDIILAKHAPPGKKPLPPKESAEDGGRENVPVMCIDGLLSCLEGDVDLARELTTMFLVHAPVTMDKLREALLSGDSACIKHEANKMKGMSADIGAERFAALMSKLQDYASSSADGNYRSWQEKVEQEFAEVVKTLQGINWQRAANG